MAGLGTQLRGPNANSKCSSCPGAICNRNELEPNEIDPDHLVSPSLQLIEVPDDNLLDHLPKKGEGGNAMIASLYYCISTDTAAVDGILGFHSFLAPMSAAPPACANDSDPDFFSHFLQNVDIPPDNLLDHSQHLASVDGIPGSLHPSRLERCSVLGSAVILAVHPVIASGVNAGASNHLSHAGAPD